jgi:tungstate transport system ATP-binding protein
VIEVKGLAKSYNGRCVVRIDDLSVRQGELLAILGPNGAGKSTLLRVLHALEPPDRGEVWFGGKRIAYPAPLELRRRISMVFQRPVLFNGNVRDNVRYGLKLRGRVDGGKVDRIMTRLGLMELADANVRTLSGGEAQRVALARSLILEPDLLLLDEPTANLDPSNAALIETIINELRGKRKSTILLVSHNVSQALRLADRTLVIFSGECIEVIEGENFLESAKDPRTKSYIQGTFPY